MALAAGKALVTGRLRHRLTIQTRNPSRTAQGGFTYSWNALRTVYAAVNPKTGREFWFAENIRAQMTHAITIRAQTEVITPDMRLVWGSRSFNILSALRIDEVQHIVEIAAVEDCAVSDNITTNLLQVTTNGLNVTTGV